MNQPADNREFDARCGELIKSLARSLGQMGLYKSSHPAVQQSLSQAHALLGTLLSAGASEITISLDNDKVLANGRILFGADNLPGSLRNIFTRLRLHSVTFSQGATLQELTSFCELSSLKTEAGVKPGDFLRQRGVEKIRTNEALYAKVEKKPQGAVQQPSAAASAPAAGSPVEKQLSGQTLESTIEILAGKASPDRDERQRIVGMVMEQFRKEVEQKVMVATEKLKKEKKTVENERVRTESVISTMAEGVVVVDNTGKILMMNPAAEQISGKTLTEAAGKPVFDIAGLEKQVVALAKEIAPPSDKEISKEVSLKGDADASKSLRQSTAIVQSQDGKIVGTVSVTPDVAKYKEVQKMQQEFVANVTHELRSPLTSIRAALDMLNRELKGKMAEDESRVFNTAVRNAERLNSLITDILDFSKLESGKLVMHPEEAAPLEIAMEAAEAMQSWARTKAIRLSLKAVDGLPKIYADKKRSSQILINLISNSIKFTPNDGSIEIAVERGQGQLSQFLAFWVKDTGCGISKEDQNKIFQKFVQVAAGEHFGGTGLGLAITKALVVMQGGQIQLDSEPGKGSTFKVFLPIYAGQRAETAPELPEPPKPKSWWRKLLGM